MSVANMDWISVAKSVLSCPSYALMLLAVLVAVYLWYRIAYMPYTVFTKLGIPGPRPKAFFGNFIEINKGGIDIFVQLTREHGKVCGMYKGGVPMYVVADPDLLKHIMIKEFSNFVDRIPPFESNGLRSGVSNGKTGLLFRMGEDWQQTRHIVTPTFTSGKLKMMVHLVEESCSALTERVQKISEAHTSEDIWRLYGEFTMETILAIAFGYKVELLRGKVDGGDELIKTAQDLFNIPIGGGMASVILVSLNSHFHWLSPLMRLIGSRLPVRSKIVTLRKTTLSFVQARKANPATKKKDFLQLIIDARVDDDESQDTSSQTKKKLTDEDIVAVATEFMLAGYETTSNTLGYTSYLLALNTDKQDKLCAEIDTYYEKNQESSLYDAAKNIEYLDWVIQESLRIYPPGSFATRHCQKTCTINGVTFLKGSDLLIPIYALHHSSEYWDEPDQFRPERFHPDENAKRHPSVHMPFGMGPRHCIGMRFALMEAKMALLSILRRFKYERSPDTEVPLKIRQGITLGPVNGIHLNVVQRSSAVLTT